MGESIYFANQADGSTLVSFLVATGVIALLFLLPWLWSLYQNHPKFIIRRFTRKGKAFGLMQRELQQLLDGLLEMNRAEQAMLLLKDYDFMDRMLRQMGRRQWSQKGFGAIACYRLFLILEKLNLKVLQHQYRRRMLKPGGSVVYLVAEQGLRLKFTLVNYKKGRMILMAPRSVQQQIPMMHGRPWASRPCSLLLFGLGRNGRVIMGRGLVFQAVPEKVHSNGQILYLTCSQVQRRNDVQLAVRRYQRRYAPEVKALVTTANGTLQGRLLNLSTRGCALLLDRPARIQKTGEDPVFQLLLPGEQTAVTKGKICSVSSHRQQQKVTHLYHIRFTDLSRATYLLLANFVYRYDLAMDQLTPTQVPKKRSDHSWIIPHPDTPSSPSKQD